MSSILRRNKPEAECTMIGTKEDGTRSYVCKVDEGKVFQVEVDKSGNVNIDAKFVLITNEEYKKIHEALRKGQSAVV
jgi:hypothetical protein